MVTVDLTDNITKEVRLRYQPTSPLDVDFVGRRKGWKTILIVSPLPEHKNLKSMYRAVFEIAEEGGYTITIPNLPGCVTEADTFEDGLKAIFDALEGWAKVARDRGLEIPEPDAKG